jgi:hypothetical protein
MLCCRLQSYGYCYVSAVAFARKRGVKHSTQCETRALLHPQAMFYWQMQEGPKRIRLPHYNGDCKKDKQG